MAQASTISRKPAATLLLIAAMVQLKKQHCSRENSMPSLRFTVLLVGLCSMIGIAAPVCAQRHTNAPLPEPGIPASMGVNIHFNDPRPGEMEQLAAEGFRWIRQDFSWAGIEREKGRYDFSAYERLLAALQPYQIRPIFILDYGNDLYEQGSPRSPEARAAFARFAAAAVSHFNNRGI